jgi:hypothetical protein
MWGIVYIKTTYGPLTETALYLMLLMQADPLHGQVGGGLRPVNLDFLGGPKCHSPNGSRPFHMAQKSLDLQGPTPSHLYS